MRAVVWTGPREMILQSVPKPEPSVGEVLVRVEAVGICGSELSGYLGENSLRVPPLIMGHEFAGTVASLGESVGSLEIGERVTVNPLLTCGKCDLCLMKLENLCSRRQLIGVHRSGAFAEYVVVPAANCVPIPADLSSLAGSLSEPLACAIRAVRVGGVGDGSRVLIQGAGAIGLLGIIAVQKAGGRVVTVAEVNPGRLATAAEWGAELTCDARTEDPAAVAKESTDGLGVDVVIDAVGSETTRRTAVKAVRPGGTVVLVGLHDGESQFQANDIVRNEVRMLGSFAYTAADFASAVGMLVAGDVQTTGGWLEEREMEACPGAFDQLVTTPPSAAKITLHP